MNGKHKRLNTKKEKDMRISFNHLHPGVSPFMVRNFIEKGNFEDGVHRVVLQNSRPLQCNCIEINMFDKRVFWGYRGSRKYPSPLISQKDAENVGIRMTTDVTVVFEKKGNRVYVRTCYVGSGSPKEPSTAKYNEMQECIDFWSNHALVPDEFYVEIESLEEVPQWALNAAFERIESEKMVG